MAQELQLFEFNKDLVRQLNLDDIPWWVLSDVCIQIGVPWPGVDEIRNICDVSWIRLMFVPARGYARAGSGRSESVQEELIGNRQAVDTIIIRYRPTFYEECLRQKAIALLPPPTHREQLNMVVQTLPVSIGIKHPGRIIGKNRKVVNRLQRLIKQRDELNKRIEEELSALQKGDR